MHEYNGMFLSWLLWFGFGVSYISWLQKSISRLDKMREIERERRRGKKYIKKFQQQQQQKWIIVIVAKENISNTRLLECP